MLEGWSVLAALARETKTVRLGTLVTGVTYRNPALLAKTATTLDVISGGRAIFGLGAAWFEAEHDAFGFDFPADPRAHGPPRRGADDREGHVRRTSGRRSTAATTRSQDVINVPRAVQPGGPKILVGGGGEQRTLKIAAKHADMTHWFPLGRETLQHKKDVLAPALRGHRSRPVDDRAHDGDARGRDPERRRAGRPARQDPRGAASVRHRGRHPGMRRRPPAVPRRRVHGLHVQQPAVRDAGPHRGRRRAPEAPRRCRRPREAVPLPGRARRRRRRQGAGRGRPPGGVDRLRRHGLSRPRRAAVRARAAADDGRGRHRAAPGRRVRHQQRPAAPGAGRPGHGVARRDQRRARRGRDRRRLERAGVRGAGDPVRPDRHAGSAG